MGFFQDLKEDLSTAVDEIETDEIETDEIETDEIETDETIDEIIDETMEGENEKMAKKEIMNEEAEQELGKGSSNVEELLQDAKDEVQNSKLQDDILDETATITVGMVITGDVASKGSMDLMGQVNGNIKVNGKLNITGTVNGNAEAGEVYANEAKVNGEIVSTGTIKVGIDSVIIGNITATCAVIAGAVKGDIDVKGPVVLDTSAIVMGNIKSKSVQINNGAVIEGLCSQCYADISPTKFFDANKK
jgi:cytoskeletal protein CcmA (bactofilin family)